MIQIRLDVFETNSSSTHCISLWNPDILRDWKDGKLFFFNNETYLPDITSSSNYITKEELITKYPEAADPSKIDAIAAMHGWFSFDRYIEVVYRELYSIEIIEDYITAPNGDKYLIFGYSGHD